MAAGDRRRYVPKPLPSPYSRFFSNLTHHYLFTIRIPLQGPAAWTLIF